MRRKIKSMDESSQTTTRNTVSLFPTSLCHHSFPGALMSCLLKSYQETCKICWRVLSLLFSATQREIEIGSYEEVISSSSCDKHPQLFQAILDHSSKFVGQFDVNTFIGASGTCGIEIAVSVSERTDGKVYGLAGFLYLLSSPLLSNICCQGKIVNTKWISRRLFSDWKASCNGNQNSACQKYHGPNGTLSARPKWLIDTRRLCLVPGTNNFPYVALSYVWGKPDFFKTTKANLESLRSDQALKNPNKRLGVPLTIEQAFTVTELLEERYLWVDSLCIVQDDAIHRHEQINSMASIFGNATVTIIAALGEDANFGLPGLQGVSTARNHSQQIFPLRSPAGHIKIIQGGNQTFNSHPEHWINRGWTFQEHFFSRRCLIFDHSGVSWECHCSNFKEEVDVCRKRMQGRLDGSTRLHSPFPFLSSYAKTVGEYGERIFTRPEDALAAFAGITTVFSQTFFGGFICGLPALFLDLSLCWHTVQYSRCERRKPSDGSNPTVSGLPSWSWIGWRGSIYCDLWSDNETYANLGTNTSSSLNVIPIVRWQSRPWAAIERTDIPASRLIHKIKQSFYKNTRELPDGWARIPFEARAPHRGGYGNHSVERWLNLEPPTSCYVLKTNLGPIFWHPIPLCQGVQKSDYTQNHPLLCCKTQRASLYVQQQINYGLGLRCHYSLRGAENDWVGVIIFDETISLTYTHIDGDVSIYTEPPPQIFCELVAISRGSVVEGCCFGLPEKNSLERPKKPKGSLYEFYNVLWVEWMDGIAYRRAYGRVMKDAWEALDREDIDLVLG